MISPEETGILYSSRVLHSRTRLNQGLCGTPGKQSSRMLKLVCFVYLVHLVCLV